MWATERHLSSLAPASLPAVVVRMVSHEPDVPLALLSLVASAYHSSHV